MKSNKVIRNVLLSLIFLIVGISLRAQSKSYDLSKWIVLQNSILKELNQYYVDSLPVDRISKVGMDALLAELDPYTIYIPEEENEDFQLMINNTYGGIGAIIYKPDVNGNVIINEPYADSPASRAGLRCGDEIVKVDGVATAGLNAKESSDKMKGKPGTVVTFLVKRVRTGLEEEMKVQRERIRIPDVKYCGMLDDQTGYIHLDGFTEGVASEIRADVQKLISENSMKRLVLDLRGNGGGLMSEAVDIVSIFVPKGSLVVTAKGRNKAEDTRYLTTKDPVSTDLKLAILVDSGSASSSEIVTGALQDLDRATVFGSRTFGKGLVQSIRPLPYNGQLKVTTAKYYTPSGRCVQAIDYAHRDENGRVTHIPDSLTHEFKTAGGRIVRDGCGIVPDVELETKEYARITYSLVLNGIIEQYVIDYVRRHESIPALKDFHFSDFDEFVEFASSKTFDARSSAMTYFDLLVGAVEKDGLKGEMQEQIDALKAKLEMDKAAQIRLKKDEIIPLIEEEIAVRYYFQRAGEEVKMRYDDKLRQVLGQDWLF